MFDSLHALQNYKEKLHYTWGPVPTNNTKLKNAARGLLQPGEVKKWGWLLQTAQVESTSSEVQVFWHTYLGVECFEKMHVLGPKVDSKAVSSMKLSFKTILIKWLLLKQIWLILKEIWAVLIIRRFFAVFLLVIFGHLWTTVESHEDGGLVTSLEAWGETMRVFTDRKLVSCDSGQGLRNEDHKLRLKLLSFLFAHVCWGSAIFILTM